MEKKSIKELMNNRKNERFYEVKDKYECGLVLDNDTVRKILTRKVSLGGSHGWIKNNEIWLRGLVDKNIKLLLNRWEIDTIIRKVKEKQLLLIPRNLYLQNHRIKTTLLLAKRNRYTNKEKLETIRRRDERKLSKYY